MNQLNINHGTDCDVGNLKSGRPRDGTEGKARDGTERRPRDGTGSRPRDGTGSRPRDGTENRPRDKTILRESSLGIRNKNRITEYPQKAQTHNRPSTKRRNPWGGYVGLMDRHGRGMP